MRQALSLKVYKRHSRAPKFHLSGVENQFDAKLQLGVFLAKISCFWPILLAELVYETSHYLCLKNYFKESKNSI